MQLILASSSSYRQQQLTTLRLPFNCHSPNIDETPLPNERPIDLCRRLALEKAKASSKLFKNHLIIGSDQVAQCDNSLLCKPGTTENAIAQLQQCSGKAVAFYTGIALFNSKKNTYQLDVATFTVHFRELSTLEIENYIQTEKPLQCAGAFMVEGLGITLFERLEGADHNSLIGLPLIKLCNLLRNEGINPLTPQASNLI
ncbi:MAF protein [Sinobacterium caligoides]|uniref:7-methyl-GTP pyrophosphatase n=1 Tax=Sinobacterium caligoides TaxID=933926 RepID=A0A3N2DJV5_9GAMM|nr:nucleoside triphosphate pyrophosphatase [Sinobacterium caligoides]ROS00066.1 MAF protein [Sinobacterium caligoides]